jgi:hypothetical protein
MFAACGQLRTTNEVVCLREVPDGDSEHGRSGIRRFPVRWTVSMGSRTARIALMTSIGVTNRTGTYNRATAMALS